MAISTRVVWAHGFAEAAERARRSSDYAQAAELARSASRLVERDRSRPALEAYLRAKRTESWAWHMRDQLSRAELAARQGLGQARQLARGTVWEAAARLRLIEVWLVEGRVPTALRAAWRLGDQLEGEPWASDIRLASAYTALGCAAKLGDFELAEKAERRGERALRERGGSKFEFAFRREQAIAAVRSGHFGRADALLIHVHELTGEDERRGLANRFVLAHLHLAAGDIDTGLEILDEVVRDGVETDARQPVRAALEYMAPWVPERIRERAEQTPRARAPSSLWN